MSSLSITDRLNSKLTIEELDNSTQQIEEIKKIAALWRDIAHAKIETATKRWDIFSAAREIALYILHEDLSTRGIRILQAKAGDEIQAIAITKQVGDNLRLMHLLTHPRNIRASVNKDESHRVTGAGSAIINYLKSIMSAQSIDQIDVEPIKSAIPFYEKMGFEFEDDDSVFMIYRIDGLRNEFFSAA